MSTIFKLIIKYFKIGTLKMEKAYDLVRSN